MTETNSTTKQETVVHAASIRPRGPEKTYLLLRSRSDGTFRWSIFTPQHEEDTGVTAPSIAEAMQLAFAKWHDQGFRPLHCGMRFTLPERDEIGRNALFHEMVASYRTPTGNYMDTKISRPCIVNKASQEALDLWKTLAASQQL